MKTLAFLVAFLIGAISGFALSAWALYEPVTVGPAKYALTRSPGPVPAYALDGTQKWFRMDCISESAKDCPQTAATPIPEPGTVGLMCAGLAALLLRKTQVESPPC